ncbi:hypothetical protein RDI58_011227 [Solanum bulbocastanum]|uniref:Uncharacterized protein n=1 Tax=Solanum bulbocastanum TaxID=147425 RepID=A0AAN8YHG7_SOLBU
MNEQVVMHKLLEQIVLHTLLEQVVVHKLLEQVVVRSKSSGSPQKQVLAHPAVAGFFTHYGWNSTLESILDEVPLICRPFLADQLVNVRSLIPIYKIGFEWEVMEKMVIEKTVRKLMLSEEGKDVKKRVADMQHSFWYAD